jgi:hypothetical protein
MDTWPKANSVKAAEETWLVLQHRFHEELVSTKSCLWRRKRKLSAEAAVLMNKRTVHMLDKQSKVRIINQSINQSINRVLDHFHLPGIVPRKVVAIPTMVSFPEQIPQTIF